MKQQLSATDDDETAETLSAELFVGQQQLYATD